METNTVFLSAFNHNVALLILLGFIMVIVWTAKLLLWKSGVLKSYRRWFELFTKLVLPIGFLVTLSAMLMSLYYQFSLGVQPCELCWFARIFTYPLVFIFGLAWLRGENAKQTGLYDHIMLLSFVGMCISLYHHYLQLGFNLYKPCSTGLFAVDCAKPTFVEFGFITLPFAAFVTLSITLLLAITGKMFQKS